MNVKIENFVIMPFNSVKASRKRLTMINGTATQSIIQMDKHEYGNISGGAKEHLDKTSKTAEHWLEVREVQCLQRRKEFILSWHSNTHEEALQGFMDIAFRIFYEH